MVKSADTRTMLFNRKADSRLTIESSSGCPLRRSARNAKSPKEPSRTNERKTRKTLPTGPEEKACIEDRIPDRVRKVPKIVKLKAMIGPPSAHEIAGR